MPAFSFSNMSLSLFILLLDVGRLLIIGCAWFVMLSVKMNKINVKHTMHETRVVTLIRRGAHLNLFPWGSGSENVDS